jgi:hypothetical protein
MNSLHVSSLKLLKGFRENLVVESGGFKFNFGSYGWNTATLHEVQIELYELLKMAYV